MRQSGSDGTVGEQRGADDRRSPGDFFSSADALTAAGAVPSATLEDETADAPALEILRGSGAAIDVDPNDDAPLQRLAEESPPFNKSDPERDESADFAVTIFEHTRSAAFQDAESARVHSPTPPRRRAPPPEMITAALEGDNLSGYTIDAYDRLLLELYHRLLEQAEHHACRAR
jgi:hypothetical protein